MTGFDVVWQRIVTLQGQVFHQKRGKPFTYVVSGGCVVPSTTNRLLPRSQFALAFERAPLDGPGQLQDLQGPSYLFAILTDRRISTAGAALPRQPATAQGSNARGGHSARAEPDTLTWPGHATESGRFAGRATVPSPMLATGALPPAEALSGIEPRRALLVVTCSAAKARGGQPPGAVSTVTAWPKALLAARARVLATADADLSAVMPAWRRYTGTFYQHAHPALAAAATAGHLVIISGGYGLVRADEPIGWYDKQFRLTDWPPGLLESALIGEARRTGAQTVVAFASATTQYSKLLRQTPWRNAGIRTYLVTVVGVSGGAMVEVPRRLGDAFSVFWNGQDGAYPPGAIVEDPP